MPTSQRFFRRGDADADSSGALAVLAACGLVGGLWLLLAAIDAIAPLLLYGQPVAAAIAS